MDLPSTLGARRLCYLAGRAFWVRPCTLAGWADILAWLDDMTPGRDERRSPPQLADPDSQELLRSAAGRVLLAWIALRDSGVGYDEAARLWSEADADEQARLLDVLMGRRRTLEPAGAESATDLGGLWLGKEMSQFAWDVGIEAMGRLTLDQFEWLLSGGECDRHADPGREAAAECQRIWEQQQAERKRREAEGAQG